MITIWFDQDLKLYKLPAFNPVSNLYIFVSVTSSGHNNALLWTDLQFLLIYHLFLVVSFIILCPLLSVSF